jgi:hypothetical protein
MRNALVVMWMLACSAGPAAAQVSVGIGLPNVSIGINLPVYPQLVAVPGYPVYYAPQVNSNYFFYDGMYWVYQGDNWYASSWYNGPWGLVARDVVPLYVLRVPVRYYRRPPVYFSGWQADAPPRWGEYWGNEWAQHRSGWDHWNRNSAPAPAPLPVYQRQYSGDRYPQSAQQQALQSQNYRYQPRDPVVRQQYQAQHVQRSAPAQSQQQRNPEMQQQSQAPRQGPAPHAQPAPKAHGQQPQQGAAQYAPAPKAQGDGKGAGKDPKQGQGHDKESQKGDDRSQDHKK